MSKQFNIYCTVAQRGEKKGRRRSNFVQFYLLFRKKHVINILPSNLKYWQSIKFPNSFQSWFVNDFSNLLWIEQDYVQDETNQAIKNTNILGENPRHKKEPWVDKENWLNQNNDFVTKLFDLFHLACIWRANKSKYVYNSNYNVFRVS